MKQLVLLSLSLPLLAKAQTTDVMIAKNVKDVMPKVIEWRRHFHQNPELSTREYKTSAFVADYLKSLGLEVKYPGTVKPFPARKLLLCRTRNILSLPA